jgi:hypothetical protein
MKTFYLLIVLLFVTITFWGCQTNDLDVPFTYESDNFEVPSAIKFRCSCKNVDSLKWSVSENLSNPQSIRPVFSNPKAKETLEYIYEPGYYDVSLQVFIKGKEQKYTKRIQIFAPTLMDVIVVNQYERFVQNWSISVFNSEEDARLFRNPVAAGYSSIGYSVTFSRLKPQRYFFRVQNERCDSKTIDKVFSTKSEIIAHSNYGVSLSIDSGEAPITLINQRGSSVKIYLCRNASCGFPSSLPPDYEIESGGRVTFIAPLGSLSFNYIFDNGSGTGGGGGVDVKCDKIVEYIIGN